MPSALLFEISPGPAHLSPHFPAGISVRRCDSARVLSLVYRTHTSAAEAFKDAVVRNSLADERVGTRHGALNLGCALKQVNERHPSDPGPCHQFTGEVFLAFLLSD